VDTGALQKYHHLQTRKKQHRESHKAISVLSITRTGFFSCLMKNSQTVTVFARGNNHINYIHIVKIALITVNDQHLYVVTRTHSFKKISSQSTGA
jgi:hypothetical protein